MQRFMTRIAALALLGSLVAVAAPNTTPKPGEGKYAFCQRMYDACMDRVVGRPGSQSYNVGRARCRGKWNSCRKGGSWPSAIRILRGE